MTTTWCVKHAPRLCVGAPTARGVCCLELPWYGGSRLAVWLTATSALWMCLESSLKRWSMCLRKFVMISISGIDVLTLKNNRFVWTTVRFRRYPWFLCMWVSSECMRRTRLLLHEEGLICSEGIDPVQKQIRNQRPSAGQKQNIYPTAAHQPRHNQVVHQGSGYTCWMLHLLVPGFQRIARGEYWRLASLMVLRLLSSSEIHSYKKLNERSATGSAEVISSGSEELSWWVICS